jgi:hypothetical protein
MDVSAPVDAFARLVACSTRSFDPGSPSGPTNHDLESVLADALLVTAFVESVRLRAVSMLDARSRQRSGPAPGPADPLPPSDDACASGGPAGTADPTSAADPTGTPDPEEAVGRVGNAGRREARRSARRARTVESIPELGRALADGSITPAHVDAIGHVLARLDTDERERLVRDGAWLVAIARQCTPEELDRIIVRRLRRSSTDDRTDRFERQRRATSLRSWIDPETGMVCMRGEFDPEIGARLLGALHHEMERLFHDERPSTCPTGERAVGHLRALALASLVFGHRVTSASTGSSGGSSTGSGAAVARPPHSEVDIVVVIDHETLVNGLHEHSRFDVSHGVDVPLATLRRWACDAAIYPAVCNGHGAVLDLGRRQRFASRDQRRALRAMHPTCMAPGCTVPFDDCQIHHLEPWQHGGRTDLAGMGPMCGHDHHLVHEGGHVLTLDPVTRVTTMTAPDGTVRTSHRPERFDQPTRHAS